MAITSSPEGTNVYREYDAAGNTSQATEIPHTESDGETQRRWSRHYYDAAGRLRATRRYARERYVGTVGNDDLVQEYRYDALGRRVIVHARHEPSCEERCHSAITRYLWEGDRLLVELRADGQSGADLQDEWDSGEQYGRVGYIHGPSLDHPLGVLRRDHPLGRFLVVPHADWKGRYAAGTDAGGQDCTESTCGTIDWPAPKLRTYHDGYERPEGHWMGSLLQGMRDAGGMDYRRNRYYDPHAGQFSQPDPIGLAGGLNLYGFAGGDPVNLSDPFGLCSVCYVVFEAGATLYDVGDLAVTAFNYLNGEASSEELAVTAMGAAAGVVLFGGGAGQANRIALNRAKGLAFERSVGITGSKRAIESLTGTATRRFPDELTATAIREAKSGRSVSFGHFKIREFLAIEGGGGASRTPPGPSRVG